MWQFIKNLFFCGPNKTPTPLPETRDVTSELVEQDTRPFILPPELDPGPPRPFFSNFNVKVRKYKRPKGATLETHGPNVRYLDFSARVVAAVDMGLSSQPGDCHVERHYCDMVSKVEFVGRPGDVSRHLLDLYYGWDGQTAPATEES